MDEKKNTTNSDQPAQDAKLENQEQSSNEEVIDSYQDRYIRLSADFQNLQRRMAKERVLWMDSAKAGVLKGLLDIVDNFDRAMADRPETADKDVASWMDGANLIAQSFHKMLDDCKVVEIDNVSVFNPELHEAVMRVPAQDKESGSIVQVLQKGYTVNGKLLRAAKVSVAE
ncbi:nucleotide exchange factor GrpE [bacterium]|jgi:molecular chaperone GrpE|nr:nucleotide exchange factor GrpE [bacterium]MBT3903900.1 nucleotide exchange factor GrpE [bacterium]MBT4577849.1 nucleotide exchange factor GrpE [bacterium]MBT5346022.1 nucleotide exchange factor GrpE [bacterium]MBT6131259.1 nucleotide exchange factor GrpE [bacterium]